MPAGGTVRTRRGDDPKRVIVRLTLDLDARAKLMFEPGKLASDGMIDSDPLPVHELRRDRSYLVGARIGEPPRDVDLIVAGDESLDA